MTRIRKLKAIASMFMLAVQLVGISVICVGCGSGGGNDVVTFESAPVNPNPAPVPSTTLTVRKSTTLDLTRTDLFPTGITSLALLSADRSSVLKTGTVSGGVGSVDTSGLSNGTYFIRINDNDALVMPTFFGGSTYTQFLGRNLHTSIIGTADDASSATSFFETNPGSGAKVVKFSTATGNKVTDPKATPDSTAFFRASTSGIFTGRMSNGDALAAWNVGIGFEPEDHSPMTWFEGHRDYITSHGGTPAAAGCYLCHANGAIKPSTYSSMTVSEGWCWKCHNGPSGHKAGMVDPNQ